jgi:hypothetical protein
MSSEPRGAARPPKGLRARPLATGPASDRVAEALQSHVGVVTALPLSAFCRASSAHADGTQRSWEAEVLADVLPVIVLGLAMSAAVMVVTTAVVWTWRPAAAVRLAIFFGVVWFGAVLYLFAPRGPIPGD